MEGGPDLIEPGISALTVPEAQAIAGAIATLWAVAFGIRIAIRTIRS